MINAPTNREECIALAHLIIAELDKIDALLDEAIARCEASSK